jgi:hypothetical protein
MRLQRPVHRQGMLLAQIRLRIRLHIPGTSP